MQNVNSRSRLLLAFTLVISLTGCLVGRADERGSMNFKFLSSGQALDDAAIFAQVIQGNSLKPPAPTNLRGTRDSAGNLEIEWTRRDRLNMPLLNSTGTPLNEESEVYDVDIYSGSTLKRTVRLGVNRLTGEAVRWRSLGGGLSDPTISDDGSVAISGLQNTVVSQQVISGDFTLELGADPANDRIPNNTILQVFGTELTSTPPFFALGRIGPTDNNNLCQLGDGVNSVGVDLTYPARLYVVRTGSEMKAYLNILLPSSAPIFTAAPDYSGPLTIQTYVNAPAGTGHLYQPRISYVRNRSWLYTTLMQTNDFGSVQSSIKVRVAQESATVGRGPYVEKTL